MTGRRPLVINNGKQQELATADTLVAFGARVVEGDVGNGSSTSFDVTHSFGLSTPFACQVIVCIKSTGVVVIPDVTFKDANTVTLTFGTAPTTNQYHYRIQG